MAQHAATSNLETTVNDLTDDREDGQDNTQPDAAYTPVFSKQVRTVVYVLGLIASCVGLGFMTFGDAAIGGYISTVAGFLASGLGVAYNPLRKN
ncbi:hypothetical protein ACE15Y_03585 [Bifidobacterium bifidum]|uniref:hypothetical protein n=1 Tax=Bifidobacterium bifidum TaxID=1681 RepID=UPI002060DE08|nr:MAG TPA: UbiA prenyltransferase family protein [Caudoviricetes sp.]